jgi:hypothetical protein
MLSEPEGIVAAGSLPNPYLSHGDRFVALVGAALSSLACLTNASLGY